MRWRAKLRAILAAVSPLCGAPLRGTPFFMRAAFTSIRMLIRETRQKCDFASFCVFVLRYPQFYILHFTFTIQKEILRRFAPQDDRGGGLASRGVNKKLAEIFVKFFPKKYSKFAQKS